jgi:hypothetical protein
MASTTKEEASYSEPKYVLEKHDAQLQFYRPDISEMLVPAVPKSLSSADFH